jgi:hypothetical protein
MTIDEIPAWAKQQARRILHDARGYYSNDDDIIRLIALKLLVIMNDGYGRGIEYARETIKP